MKSAPALLRRIRRAFLLGAAVLLALAVWLPAPLQAPAELRRVPNPVKAAWFLVWVQELVSHSNAWIYPVLGVGGLFVVLPYLPWVPPAERAAWFPRDQRAVNVLTVGVFAAIVGLTVVALFLRGENWHFVWPF